MTAAGARHVDGAWQWLRDLEVFAGPLPAFDPESAPIEPVRLFLSWLVEAVTDGVRDPHAMTLSTVDAAGDPDARMPILKGVDASGRQFAGHAFSPKGGRLACHPRAALTSYWPEHGRQVRVRGPVSPGSAEAAPPTSSGARRRPGPSPSWPARAST
ncbi:pyridoxamine 5'-phosphate oxidase family protein [Streptomyces sp. NPDC087917]|uniref:pyridoxamine 5'-phosphate oxidase family protein n=1 Tax=Streptomyces sp. NPDC087917 TaxID=3155060 RepID=UPI00341B0628